jgi:uncharacterized surface protein with fasciclin (FAS1) repeats
MFKPLNIRKILLLVFSIAFLASCNTDDGGVQPADSTIAEIVANSTNLSTLQRALVRANLESTLQASGSLTLFAPTNAAFEIFLANANFANIDEVPVPVLQQLLLNHVVGARIDESLLRVIGKNYTETRADGPSANTKLALYFDATAATIVLNGTSDIVDADLPATNGLVHLVDAVIDLPTLATFVQANDAFSQLVTALTTATPATNFMTTLSGSTAHTLFAPADAAIDELLDSNPAWTKVDDIDEALLTAILEHHLVSGNLRSDDINDDDTAVSLEGDLLTFSTANGRLDITDGSGNEQITVVVADIQANNGVLHAVEKVLMPDTGN